MPTLKYKDPITGEYKSDIHVVGAVSSVNGKTGVVEIDNSDITEALGYTPADASTTQEKLIAGSGITIADDGKTISATGGGSDVSDVRINGTSVVTDGVANVPIATDSAVGLTMGNTARGTHVAANGSISIVMATNAEVDNRNVIYKPIVPNNLDYAVKEAMCDGKGAAWTSTEQAAARTRMDAASQLDVDKLKASAEGHLYMFQQDSAEAYTKPVPSDAMQWATFDKVGGKTLVWNQQVNITNACDNEPWFTRISQGEFALNGDRELPNEVYMPALKNSTSDKNVLISGHTYFARLYSNKAYDTSILDMYVYASNRIAQGEKFVFTWTPTSDANSELMVTLRSQTFDNQQVKVICVDLTLMFGAGNEPTAEQFEAMFPADYYPYSEPTLMTYSPDKVQSSTGDTKDLSALVQKYFPNGMKSAGAVHDEIDLERGVAVQRVKTTTSDMLTSRWSNTGVEATTTKAYQILFDGLNKATTSIYRAGICDRFNHVGHYIYNDDRIGMAIFVTPQGTYLRLRVNKTDVPDATAMAAYITANHFEFAYELTNPIETPIDPTDLADLAFLNVEAGGSLTFANDQGDAYHVPLPNQETWMIKLPGVTA